MESSGSQRWYATTATGKHIFFIEVSECQDVECMMFNTSLPIEFFHKKEIANLTKHLFSRTSTAEDRENIATKIINLLMQMPGINQHFFDESHLNKNGYYCEEYENTISDLKSNPPLKETTPYSAGRNEIIFSALKSKFTYQESEKESLTISREYFENKIGQNPELQDAYTEEFRIHAEYFLDFIPDDGGGHLEVYCMVVAKELKFVFLSKSDQ